MSEERPTSSDGATRPADSDPSRAATNGFLVNNPARTGYDPSVKWWVNYMRIMMGQVTAEGAHHYREDRYRANEQRDVARCQKYRDVLMQKSPLIVFLREKIEALHGKLDGDNVVCRRCPALIRPDGTVARQAGGFSPAHGIVVCSNEVRSRAHLEDTLAHEMVHAWDHLRWKVDWVGEKSLRHAACTEVSSGHRILLRYPVLMHCSVGRSGRLC